MKIFNRTHNGMFMRKREEVKESTLCKYNLFYLISNVGASFNKIFMSNKNKIRNVYNAEENLFYKNQNIYEILKSNESVHDLYFLPEIKSLIPSNLNDPSYKKTPKHYIEEYNSYIWLRPDEIYGINKYKLFIDKLDPQDIYQGSLGSCYLLSAIIGLSHNEGRIKKIFITKETNSKGVYAVKFLIQGEYQIITIDDYIPCLPFERTPAFSKSKNNEIWLILIEKAWAKINGSCYMKTWLGTPFEALTTLCEAPCFYENHSKYIKKKREILIWEKIMKSLNKNWIICADTEEISKEEEVGLIPFHAYSIIDYYFIAKNDIKLLKIRNPWGNKEWKGDYSNNCPKWTTYLKKKVDYDIVRKGIFFMTFEDFLKYFTWSFYSKYEDNYHYRFSKYIINENSDNSISSFKSTSLNLNSNFVTAFIEVSKETYCFISLHQPQKRYNENIVKCDSINTQSFEKDEVPIGLLILLKCETHSKKFHYKYINSDFINMEKIVLEVKLQPGEYHVFCKSLMKYQDKMNLVVSTYSEIPLEIYNLPLEDIDPKWLENLLVGLAKTNANKQYFPREKDSYSSIILKDSNLGYGIFYYENNSENGTLYIKLKFENSEGIKIINYHKNNNDEYEIIVNPKDNSSMLIEYINLPTLCKISWANTLKYDYPCEIIVKKYINTSSCKKIVVIEDLFIYVIYYEIGYHLVVSDNYTKNEYLGKFKFEDTNCTIDDKKVDIQNGVEFKINSKSRKYLKIKSESDAVNNELKFIHYFKKLQ